MRATTIIFIGIVFAAAMASGVAHAGSYGTELPFASGTSARASAMGLAATSLPGTPSTQYFNPALLATQKYRGFEFYRTTFFESDVQYHSAAYVHPSLDWGTLGVTVLRLDVGGIEERDASNLLLSSDLKNSQTRVLFGYALGILPSVSAGVNLKADHYSFGSYDGSAIGLDIGFLATRSFSRFWWARNVRGSLMAENAIEPSVKLDQVDVPDPRRITFGLSVDGRRGDFGTATSIDLVSPKYSPFHARFGQEVTYRNMAAVRAGMDDTTPTFGIGGTYRSISLDYAFRDEDLGSNHRVSLSVAFGQSLDEARHARRAREDEALHKRVQAKVGEFERSQLSSLMEEADSKFAAGDFDSARKKYGMALMWDSQNARALSRIPLCDLEQALAWAGASLEASDFATALHHYSQASNHGPDDPRVAAGLAACNSAIAETEDRVNVTSSLLAQAVEVYAQGRHLDAVAAFQGVLELDPNNTIARELLQKCGSSIDTGVSEHRRQARDHERRGDLAAAIASLERATALTGTRAEFAAELTRLRSLLAKQEKNAAAARRPKPEPVLPVPDVDYQSLDGKYEQGVHQFERGNFREAARLLSQVWTVAPDYRHVAQPLVRAYLLHGMTLYSDGRYDDAIDVWQRVLMVDPDNSKSKRYLQKVREERSRLSGVAR